MELQLNRYQKQALVENDSHLIINAGPGTGKTHLLVEKVVYLLNKENFPASNILALTFTKKASNEIKKRISSKTNIKFNNIFTFHSFAFWILQKCSISTDKLVLDEKRDEILEQIKEELEPSNKYKQVELKELLLKITVFKNTKHPQLVNDRDLWHVVNKYKQKMHSLNLIDYDDLIINAINCIAHNPDIKKKLKEQFRYIIIDEFQDTTTIQLELLLSFLDIDRSKIMAIGDRNQSIYAFRGSNIGIFNLLKEKLNNVKEISLKINYRSTQKILDVASSLVDVKLSAFNNSDKSKCEIIKTFDEYSEADFVLRKISYLMRGLDLNQASWIINDTSNIDLGENNFQFSDFAILYRNHFLSKIIEDRLFKSSIPYMGLGENSVYQKEHIKFIVNFLKFINSGSLDCFWNIVASKHINWGKRNIEKLKRLLPQNIKIDINKFKNIVLQNFTGKSLEKLVVAKNGNKMNFFELLNSLRKLDKPKEIVDAIVDYYNLDQLSLRKKVDIVSFSYKMEEFENIEDFLHYLDDIKESAYFDKHENKIVLSSIHSVKGLEFENVFLIGLEDGILPKNLENFDEEKRLFYVAITRAKKNFFATYTKYRFKKKATISSFDTFLKDSSCEFIEDENLDKLEKRMLKKKAKQAQLGLFNSVIL